MTVPVAERGSARQRSRGIGRAAVLIGVITMLARVTGFGRQVVFAHTVLASVAVLAAFPAVVALTDGADLRAVLRRAVRA